MRSNPNKSRRRIYFGMILIAMGVTFNSALNDTVGTLGIVFIALGGLFFVAGMSLKRKEESEKNNPHTAEMIQYTASSSKEDLDGILLLQKANLPRSISSEEMQTQGFVTVDHSFDLLKRLNDQENHLIAKDGDQVVGYVLAMTREARFDIPVLVPMFEVFDSISFHGKKIADCRYLVVGQVCVDKNNRGRGIFDQCYLAYREMHQHRYDFAITEIDSRNERSLRAHQRIGFEVIHTYEGTDGRKWIIVAWDWKNDR